MEHTDNSMAARSKLRENLGKARCLAHFTILLLAFPGVLACKNDSPGSEKTAAEPDKPGAASRLAEGDQLYRQREDLSKARQAVVAHRQARTADYGNYEAAWKLARSCYYLGAHTDDGLERDAAFREGIEAGETAVE